MLLQVKQKVKSIPPNSQQLTASCQQRLLSYICAMSDKKHFFLKLNPPRPTFVMDMTEDEKVIMHKHVEYWKPMVEDGRVIVLGPVLDPKGGFGISILRVDNEEEVKSMIEKDPANGLNSFEYHPMMAVTKIVA